MTDKQYEQLLLIADNALQNLTDSGKMPGTMNAQAENFRAEIHSELEHLEEKEEANV